MREDTAKIWGYCPSHFFLLFITLMLLHGAYRAGSMYTHPRQHIKFMQTIITTKIFRRL